VRYRAAATIAQISPESASDAVVAALEAALRHPEAATLAHSALVELGDRASVSALTAAIQGAPGSTREASTAALAYIDPAAARRYLPAYVTRLRRCSRVSH
jgi:hypothetical protein